MSRPIRARIDLAALRHNLARVRQLAPASHVMAVVKADGYGHGLTRCVGALQAADGFGLLTVEEAVQLREAGTGVPLCLLEGFFHRDELDVLARHRIAAVVHHPWQLEALSRYAGATIRVWIKLDSGMHRIGFAPPELGAVYRKLAGMDPVYIEGVMSHLACADCVEDDATRIQLEGFTIATAGLNVQRSLANSAAIMAWPDTRLDWVRPGIMLYGASPLNGRSAADLDLRPVMTLESCLIAVNRYRAGDAIGYGASWRCPEDMVVGVVACGYGDGYPRHAPSGTPLLIGGRRVPLVGRVSMDMITVDLRDCPDATVGTPAVLWGEGLPVEDIASAAGTISYELLCRVTARVPRTEVNGGH